jgi:general secretion pathway protein E
VSREYLLYHAVCPRALSEDGTLVVATAPGALLPDALDDLGIAYGCKVVSEPAPTDDVERLIERLTTEADRLVELARDDFGGTADCDETLTADVRDLATQPPVVRYVNLLVRDAADAGASDIHLEASRTGLTARFRLDGVLVPAPEAPAGLAHAVVSRIKLLAELDIAERRRPQDGRIRVRLPLTELDLRVSTVPTMYGESVVLRLLDRGGRPVGLDELGMPHDILATITTLARRPHGMLLVTGPTGSGKTTTLYAALGLRHTEREKLITVEDPIEYQWTGVAQVPVHAEAGVTFATALRSILRQDPDVLMVGEMRDGETATLAVQAAMTGHRVFSTLHTTDALGAIPRLTDLGVPPYLVAATVDAVLAQRLVRCVCERCAVTVPLDAASVTGFPADLPVPARVMQGAGCTACRGTGYRGRVGVFELLVLNEQLKAAVAHGASHAEMHALAMQAGWRPLAHDAWTRVAQGISTVEEVLRVVEGA